MLKTAEEEKMEFKKDLVLDKSPFLKFESISFWNINIIVRNIED